jgi:hypothetical protein
MKIGFFNNQIDERATWQAYLYAKYMKVFLGHTPVILYPATPYANSFPRPKLSRRLRHRLPWAKVKKPGFDQKMADRIKRDGVQVDEIQLDADLGHLDALHHIKSGENDGFFPRGTRYWVHAVSNASQPHGDRYMAVSQWLGRRDGASFVPHIVEVADDPQDMRRELSIPMDAVVFGRFGGRETFDIPWVWEVIQDAVARFKNVYFLFANTETKLHHDHVISLPTIYDNQVSLEVQKRRFINTCDAMLHARTCGETFGIACGEFALCGKPVLTYAQSPALSHIELLGHPLRYNDPKELTSWIERGASGDLPREDGGAYRNCTPEKVMSIFDQRFIR